MVVGETAVCHAFAIQLHNRFCILTDSTPTTTDRTLCHPALTGNRNIEHTSNLLIDSRHLFLCGAFIGKLLTLLIRQHGAYPRPEQQHHYAPTSVPSASPSSRVYKIWHPHTSPIMPADAKTCSDNSFRGHHTTNGRT